MIKEPLTSRLRSHRRATYLKLTGDLDHSAPTPEALVQSAQDSNHKLFVLDLTDVPTLNSDGIEWLERVAAKAEAEGVNLRVIAPAGSRVRRVLELMRFDRFVLVVGGIIEALRFGRRPKTRG